MSKKKNRQGGGTPSKPEASSPPLPSIPSPPPAIEAEERLPAPSAEVPEVTTGRSEKSPALEPEVEHEPRVVVLTAPVYGTVGELPLTPLPEDGGATPEASNAPLPSQADSPSVLAAPAEREPPPVKVGQILRCTSFDGGRVVAGRVDQVHSSEPLILLRLFGLNTYWPIHFNDVRGDTWVHVASNYPPPGEDPEFDARCRTPLPPNMNPLESLKRRRARRGYAWAHVTTNVGALGYALDGSEKTKWRGPTRAGERGELGEFPMSAIKGSPSCFDLDVDRE